MKAPLPPGYVRQETRIEVVALEHAENVPDDRFATPLEQMMADQTRCEVLKSMKSMRAQMVFLLREYGFTEEEIGWGMKLTRKTIANYRYNANKLRANIEK